MISSHAQSSSVRTRTSRSEAALRVVSVRRAFVLLFKRDPTHQPVAEVVSVEDGRYVSYDFEDWAQLSAMKHEEDSDALIVRLFNPTGEAVTGTLRMKAQVIKAELVNLNEAPQGEIEMESNAVAIDVDPNKIVTIRLTL